MDQLRVYVPATLLFLLLAVAPPVGADITYSGQNRNRAETDSRHGDRHGHHDHGQRDDDDAHRRHLFQTTPPGSSYRRDDGYRGNRAEQYRERRRAHEGGYGYGRQGYYGQGYGHGYGQPGYGYGQPGYAYPVQPPHVGGAPGYYSAPIPRAYPSVPQPLSPYRR